MPSESTDNASFLPPASGCPKQVKSLNLRFLATVGSNNPQEKPSTRIQLIAATTTAEDHHHHEQQLNNRVQAEPWKCEMSIEQFDQLYNVLTTAKSEFDAQKSVSAQKL